MIAAPLGAAASIDGRIEGRVIDRTAPQHVVAGQIVRLSIVERGASSDQEAASDAAGRFRFAGLPTGGMRAFVLSTEYRGVRYTSDRIVLGPDAPVRAADLAVYEPSGNRSAIRGTVAFAVVDLAKGAARVSVVQGLANSTDRTVVVSAEDPIVFPLPPGADAVRPLAGWRDPRILAGQITDTFALTPVGVQVAYTFGMRATGSQLALPWSLPYGAADLEVLVADAGVEVVADGLTARGTVTGPTGRYRRWSGGPVAPEGSVLVRLRGVPSARDPWPATVAAGLGVALSCGLAVALRRPRRTPA